MAHFQPQIAEKLVILQQFTTKNVTVHDKPGSSEDSDQPRHTTSLMEHEETMRAYLPIKYIEHG